MLFCLADMVNSGETEEMCGTVREMILMMMIAGAAAVGYWTHINKDRSLPAHMCELITQEHFLANPRKEKGEILAKIKPQINVHSDP